MLAAAFYPIAGRVRSPHLTRVHCGGQGSAAHPTGRAYDAPHTLLSAGEGIPIPIPHVLEAQYLSVGNGHCLTFAPLGCNPYIFPHLLCQPPV